MIDVVGVHGIGQQQLGPTQLLQAWRPALTDGIVAARGRDPGRPAPSMEVAYYGGLFLPPLPGTTKGGPPGTTETEQALDSLEPDEVAWFEELADELGATEADAAEWKTKAPRLPTPVARLAAFLDHRFGAAGPLLFMADLRQVRLYQRDDAVGDEARARVAAACADGCTVLVGHSLGSVVAYEIACLAPPSGLRVLVTMGSPLALTTVRKRLRHQGPPADVTWVNVLDSHDPVCCAGRLRPHWPVVEDRLVANGGDPHAAVRYLGKAQTGDAVASGLWP
jgi:hypothetical protein